MLLWPEAALDDLEPYPPEHPLARRLQLVIAGERPAAASAAAVGDSALEAMLLPGDVLYFPARWAHHTEACAASAAGANDDGAGDSGGGGEATSWSLGFRTDGTYLM